MEHVLLALPFVAIGGLMLITLGRPLDAMTLGEDVVEAMGMRLGRVRLRLITGTALVVGASTAVAGTIGFVGLVVPHLLRPWVGAMPGRLLGASALGGAAMVLLADVLVRVVMAQADLKLGVLTALIGAPLFLHLIYQTRRELT
jgi:iron complex transport system permease protein